MRYLLPVLFMLGCSYDVENTIYVDLSNDMVTTDLGEDLSPPTPSNQPQGSLPPGFYHLGCQYDNPKCNPTPGSSDPIRNPIRE